MAVEADLAGLLKNASDVDSCPFVFSGATHAHKTDAVTALGRAISDLATMGFDPDPDGFGGELPHPSPGGAASRLAGFEDPGDTRVAGWFSQLARTLTEQGWSGVLRPQRWEDQPQERPDAVPWLAVTLAVGGWGHQPSGKRLLPWAVDPSLIPGLLDLTMAWTNGAEGELWFARMNWMSGTETAVRNSLEASLSDKHFATVHRQGDSAERRVRFSAYGHVTIEERSDSVLEDRLATLRSAYVPWAGRLDRSATTGDVGPSHPGWFLEVGRRPKLDQSYYPHSRHLDDRRVPDACVEQVLTGKHLEAARDLSSWHVEEIAQDRYLVTHPTPARWFLPAPQDPELPEWERVGTRVDPATLAQAREDFGAMILHDSDL